MKAPIRVLFTHYGDDWIRGSETVLLDLLRALNKDVVKPFVWCNSAAMADAALSAGCSTVRTDFQYFLDYDSPDLSLSKHRELVHTCRALCREHDIQVLHANSAAPAQWLVPAGFSARLPVLAHLHIDYLRRSRYVLLLHAASLIVGVSRQVNEGLIADGVAPERTRVIYNGIDFSRLRRSSTDLRRTLGIAGDAFVVATTGSLIARKGHDVLIRAFRQLPKSSQPQHLLIPSEGPERGALEALTRELGLTEHVHFLGYIDNISDLYQAADVFALASRGDAFGLAFAEAGHFALPSVATRVGGIPEVVVDQETGFLVRADDVQAFASALGVLMDNTALRTQMGKAAAARADQLFTSDRMAREFESVYTALSAIPRSQLGWTSALQRLRPYARLVATAGRRPQPRYAE